MTARLEARVSSKQKALFRKAAQLAGRSLTEFLIAAAEDAANRVLARNEIVELSARDREIFVDALLNPPAPGKPLKDAVNRYKRATAAHK